MAEHKHAEVLRAIADGKVVQWQSNYDNEWSDLMGRMNPISDSHLNWRVKPEPKPDVVRYVNVYVGRITALDLGQLYNSVEECNRFNCSDAAAIAKFTVNSETGKVSVEINNHV